jgi:hypothetical protein
MGKVMKKIGGVIGKITQIVSPILSIAKMIPGVGQIAGVVQAGLSIVSNVGKIFQQGFPKGLLTAAKMAVTNFLPGPLGKIADFAMDKVNSLKSMIPAGVAKFLPLDKLPLPKGVANFI